MRQKGQAALEAMISMVLFAGAAAVFSTVMKTGINQVLAVLSCRRAAAEYVRGYYPGLKTKLHQRGTTIRVVPDRLPGAVRIENKKKKKGALPVVERHVIESAVFGKSSK